MSNDIASKFVTGFAGPLWSGTFDRQMRQKQLQPSLLRGSDPPSINYIIDGPKDNVLHRG
jgi:hypothetical protein